MSALHSPAYREFAKALAAARIGAGYTQRGLATALDTDPSFIAKYETARVRLDVIQFLKIATVLKLDPAEVLAKLSIQSGDGRLLPKASKARTADPKRVDRAS